MARNTTLVRVLDLLRVEAELSLNPAHNSQVRDSQVVILQREQDRLWREFSWPHLRVERLIPCENGQRFYAPPTDMQVDRIETIEFKSDGEWLPVGPGVGPGEYAAHDSALDERSWPVARWRIWEGEQIEVWPIPDQDADPADQNGYLKITGIRNLRPLVADTDRADLDDHLLALFGAAAIVKDAKKANAKLTAANALYGRLRAGLSPTRRFSMFGVTAAEPQRRPVISRYRAPGT